MSHIYINDLLTAYFTESTALIGGDRSSGNLYMDGEDKLSYGDKGILLVKRYRPDCLENPCYLIRSHTKDKGAKRALHKALGWLEYENGKCLANRAEGRKHNGELDLVNLPYAKFVDLPFYPYAVAAFPDDTIKSIARVVEKWDEIQGEITKRLGEIQIHRHLKWANNQKRYVNLMGKWFNIKTPVLMYNKETITFLCRARLDGKLEGTWKEVLGDD